MQSTIEYSSKHVGSYSLINLLGVGPMSRVYLAKQHEHPDQPVALKLIEAPSSFAANDRARFLEEAQRFARLKHEHILPILEAGIHEDMPYLVSEYAIDGSLHHRFAEADQPNLPLEYVLLVLTQVGTALDFAHLQNILHANLKPENILFILDGRVVVTDFRLTSLGSPARIGRLQSVNAARYMAPEQFSDQPNKQSDQYALACLAYEMCTGHAPFVAHDFKALGYKHAIEQPIPPTQVKPELPLHIENALLKALSKDPQDRYPDIPAFLAALITPARPHITATLTPLPGVPLSTLEQVTIEEVEEEAQNDFVVLPRDEDSVPPTKNTPPLRNLPVAIGSSAPAWEPLAQTAVQQRKMQSATIVQSSLVRRNVPGVQGNGFSLVPDVSRRERWAFTLAAIIICISVLGFSLWSVFSLVNAHKPATSTPPVTVGNTPLSRLTPTTQAVIGLPPMPTSVVPPRVAAPRPTPVPHPSPTPMPTPTTVPGPTSPVYPFFDCIIHQHNGTNTAFFGYMNTNATTVSIPIGDNNQFFPGGPSVGQPVLFQSGRQFAVFGVNFASQFLVWSLDHNKVTASFFGPPCP